jgi:CheY-like chemotaxis protein
MYSDNSTILIVEDSPSDAFFIQLAFEKVNLTHSVRIVHDGDAAVSYLSAAGKYANRQQYPMPSLMLLDINLPQRSGLEVLEWIQQQAHLKHLLVVMLTSSELDSDINSSYELGANSYLIKPIGIYTLEQMVKTFSQYWLLLNKMPTESKAASPLNGYGCTQADWH